MAPKRKSTPTRNPLHSDASSSSNHAPLSLCFCNDDALDDDNGGASSTDEMFTWHFYPLSFMTKMGSSFRYESSHS